MKKTYEGLVSLLALAFAIGSGSAQTVSVGSVTKYSGILTNRQDVQDVKSINDWLNVLESQVARAFIDRGEADYVDRMNTDAVFRELNLTSDSAFNPNSGGLRGLLGKLDFLVVMDASDTSSARIRLIDVESGSVKAIETCTKHWNLGIGQPTPPDCIAPFVSRAMAAVRAKRATKADRLKQQADTRSAAEHQAQRDIEAAHIQAQALERQQAADAALALAEQQAQVKLDLELNREIAEQTPILADLEVRLKEHNIFWAGVAQQLAQNGQSLRSSVRLDLDSASKDEARCHSLVARREISSLKVCIVKLKSDIATLDELR